MTAALSTLARATREDVLACVRGAVLIVAAYVAGAALLP